MSDLKDILGKKKKDKEGDDLKKEAKLGVLKDLRGLASGMMKDGMKATVIAKDKKGLEEGLDKAKDIVEESPEQEEIEGDELENEQESSEDKAEKLAEECDPEDIDALIAALEKKKREKMMAE